MKTATGKVNKAFRKHLNYTQEFVANEINITTQALARIENGIAGADMDKLHQLAKLFRIRNGQILDLATEIFETKDDSWLEKAIQHIRNKPDDKPI